MGGMDKNKIINYVKNIIIESRSEGFYKGRLCDKNLSKNSISVYNNLLCIATSTKDYYFKLIEAELEKE